MRFEDTQHVLLYETCGGGQTSRYRLAGRYTNGDTRLALSAIISSTDNESALVEAAEVEVLPPGYKYALPPDDHSNLAALEFDVAKEEWKTQAAKNLRDLLQGTEVFRDPHPDMLCHVFSDLLLNLHGDVLSQNCTPMLSSSSDGVESDKNEVFVSGVANNSHFIAHFELSRAFAAGPDLAVKQMLRVRRSSDSSQSSSLQSCLKRAQKISPVPNKDVILVLGTTGAGKSTLTQFIAGGSGSLVSEEVVDGGGEFIISDNNVRIGSGITSKTSFPERVVDPGTQATFYDFPGFADTRGVCVEVVTAALVKDVARTARSMKVILVISYFSVQKGVDRKGLVSLFKQATGFLRNIEKYDDSIVLVVSKVPNLTVKRGKEFHYISDAKIKEKIVKFLEDVYESLTEMENATNSLEERHSLKKAKLLVHTISKRNDRDEYSRIGIFRTPDEAGPLDNQERMLETKKNLKRMVFRDSSYTPPSYDDFGSMLSDLSKLQVKDVVSNLVKDIYVYVEGIAKDLLGKFQEIVQTELSFEERIDTLQRHTEYISRLMSNVTAAVSPRQFMKYLISNVQEMKFDVEPKMFVSLLNDTKTLEYLENVVDDTFVLEPLTLLEPLSVVSRYVNGSVVWYKFLIRLYDALSQYEVQRNLSKYEYLLTLDKHNINLPSFIVNLSKSEVMNPQPDLMSVPVDHSMWVDLHLILKTALQPLLVSSCEDLGTGLAKLQIRGQFISTNFVLQKLKEGCHSKIKAVELLAQHCIFIDKDLYVNHQNANIDPPAVLSVVSPKWVIVGQRKIVLSGKSSYLLKTRAESGHTLEGRGYDGSSGEDGVGGTPGAAGGSMFAVGEELVNIHHLTLESNGGNGSPGQHGGNGGNGSKGENGCCPWRSRDTSTTGNFEILIFGNKDVKAYGSPGGVGGKGGNGGKGGEGAPEGEIQFWTTSDTGFGGNIETTHGIRGKDGEGGKGGAGGSHGCTRYYNRKHFLMFGLDSWSYEYEVCPDKKNKVGEDGKSGVISSYTPLVTPCHLEPSHVYLRRFKQFTLKTLDNHIYGHRLDLFLTTLEKKQFTSISDTLPYVQELFDMESAISTHSGRARTYLPMYWRFLKRLLEFCKARDLQEDERQVIISLYLAAASTIRSLNSPESFELIIDVKGYLDYAVTTINKFNEAKTSLQILKSAHSYQASLSMKIRERMQLVQLHMLPSIEEAGMTLKQRLMSLDQEVVRLNHGGNERLRELRWKAEELRSSFRWQKILSIISAVSGAVSLLFSAGGAAVSVAGSELLTQTGSAPSMEHMSRGASEIGSALGIDLNQISEGIAAFKVMTDEWDTVMKHLNESSGPGDLLTAGLKLIKVFRTEVTPESTYFKESRTNHNGNTTTEDRILETSGSGEEKHKVLKGNGNNELTVYVDDQIAAVKESITRLKDSELLIRSIITPLFDNVIDSLKSLMQSSPGAIDIRRWRTQSTLRELKLAIHDLSKDLTRSQPILTCISILDDTLTSLISVFDQIEDYEERKSLSDYVTQTVLASAGSSSASTLEIAEAVSKLQLMLRSNLVISTYQRALQGFKQWAFPFADVYLRDIESPNSIRLTGSSLEVGSRVSGAVLQLQALKDKLAVYHTVVHSHDRYIHVNNFTVEAGSPPLFYWDRDIYPKELAALLSGEEVALPADVRLSPLVDFGDAVKFDSVNIRFVATNKSQQSDLEKALGMLDVVLTHMGDSYYTCGSKVFTISAPSQRLEFSLQRDAVGRPARRNKVYEKLASGDMMLSPFATWTLQLVGPAVAVRELEAFRGAVDLYLEGHAQYVKGFECSDPGISKYYAFDFSRAAINDVVIGDQRDSGDFYKYRRL